MNKLKRVLREVIPPIIWRLLSNFYRAGIRSNQNNSINFNKYILIEEVDVLPEKLYYLNGSHAFKISTEYLRYSGGLAYTVFQQPFLIYYDQGLKALEKYYRDFQPKNIFERHLVHLYIADANILNVGIPWHFVKNKKVKGEKGLSLEDGHQGYGPVSSKKLTLEKKRLDDILDSIRKHGYSLSLANEYPRGYFLLDKSGKYVFKVIGGQHRAAAMVYLGYHSIDVSFQPNYPRIIKETDSSNWPAVRNGYITESDALKIFKSYFRDGTISVFSLLSEFR